MAQQYTLRDIRTGKSYPVSPQGTRIGREPPNDVVLPDEGISRRHATVWVEAGRLYIRDEGSTNGTWVNERRITGPTPLRPGDRVRLGHTVMEVVATGPAMTVVIPASAIPASATPAPATPAPAIPARRRPTTSRLWWLAGLGALILCGLLALGGGLWALGRQKGIGGLLPFLKPTPTPTLTPTPTPTPTPTLTPTPTPTLTPTPIPGIERPVLIEGTEVTFVRAEKRDWFRSFDGAVRRPSSSRDTFLIVDAEVPAAQYDWDKVSEWEILLNDDIEPSIIQGLEGGEVTWVFVVRKTETSFVLTLPGGDKVNLAPILR